jgi:pyridoxamine 5'-phosphate oxidase
MDKKEVLELLKANRHCHLATVDEGMPRVRALQIFRIDENGILIQTWKDKDVGKQLSRNPEVELCFNNFKEGIQIRVRGRVELVEDNALEEQKLREFPNFQKYVDAGHEMVFYCLRHGLAHIWTIEKNFEQKAFIEL